MSSSALRRRMAAMAVLVVALACAPPSDAIVGGSVAAPGQWPWMAGLLDAYTSDAAWAQYCGGVVIAPRRVLTAAHCVTDRDAMDIDVLVGRTRLTDTTGRRIPVTSIALDAGYASGRRPSVDAAVLTLAEDAGVPPLALAQPGTPAAWGPGSSAWVVGWGALNARRSRGGNWFYADRLRALQTPIQGDDACESAFGVGFPNYPYRPGWVLCAGTGEGVTGTCYGDSGGPLVVSGPNGWIDVGVVSGGDACASRGYFDLFSRVDAISRSTLQAPVSTSRAAVPRPRVAGHLKAGAVVRCRLRRGTGRFTPVDVTWRRLGDRSGSVLSTRRAYRLTAQDARRGVTCSVSAATRAGRATATARPLRPAA